MSSRSDPPAELPARRSRAIWLTGPIDLRQAVEQLDIESDPDEPANGDRAGREEIARRLRDPRRKS